MLDLRDAEFGVDQSEIYPALRIIVNGTPVMISMAEDSNRKWRDKLAAVWLGPEWESKVPELPYDDPITKQRTTIKGYTTDARIVELFDRLLDASASNKYESLMGPQSILSYAEATAKVQETSRIRAEENNWWARR